MYIDIVIKKSNAEFINIKIFKQTYLIDNCMLLLLYYSSFKFYTSTQKCTRSLPRVHFLYSYSYSYPWLWTRTRGVVLVLRKFENQVLVFMNLYSRPCTRTLTREFVLTLQVCYLSCSLKGIGTWATIDDGCEQSGPKNSVLRQCRMLRFIRHFKGYPSCIEMPFFLPFTFPFQQSVIWAILRSPNRHGFLPADKLSRELVVVGVARVFSKIIWPKLTCCNHRSICMTYRSCMPFIQISVASMHNGWTRTAPKKIKVFKSFFFSLMGILQIMQHEFTEQKNCVVGLTGKINLLSFRNGEDWWWGQDCTSVPFIAPKRVM